jgi:glycerol uptake facilitator-like aquaporin
MRPGLGARVFAEFLGTAFLVAAVVGSGIMAERLCGGNVGLALLANTIATGAALVALILTFGPISGAQFNPVVTVADAMAGGTAWPEAIPYVVVQISGGCLGTVLANAMFGLRLVSISHHDRGGTSQLLSEFVATFGLLCVIRGCSRAQPKLVGFAVGCYITAAYWFTASTSFANPAVTVARTLSDTFAGIQPANILGFIAVQFVGGVAATLVFRWLEPKLASEPG